MKKSSLFTLVLSCLLPALYAQDAPGVLNELHGMLAESAAALAPKARARCVPALGLLPADTDSFFALAQLDKLISCVSAQKEEFTGVELASALVDELDSIAVGVSPRCVQDMQRLQPLLQVLRSNLGLVGENWRMQANDAAARAIVAVEREQQFIDGETLVQATQGFHLAPLYMVVSAKPGGESMLQQLSVLPLMLPLSTDNPIEMTVRSGWSGFCVRGDRLDLSMAELTPEQETAIMRNLEKARLYVVTRVVGNKLLLVVCSNLNEVKIPARVSDSVLAAPLMTAFDSRIRRGIWALGYSSPAVVRLREELNLHEYLNAAFFMEKIFSRLAPESETYAQAAAAVRSLVQKSEALLPRQQGAERVMVWGDKPIRIYMSGSAAGQCFAAGDLRFPEYAARQDTAVYFETTPWKGGVEMKPAEILDEVEKVRKGYSLSLSPGEEECLVSTLPAFLLRRPACDDLFRGFQLLNATPRGGTAWIVRAGDAAAGAPDGIFMSGEVADAAAMPEIRERLRSGLRSLSPEIPSLPVIGGEGNVVTMACGGSMPEPSADRIPIAGGCVFSINMPALARMMEMPAGGGSESQRELTAELGGGINFTSGYVDRVEGALCTDNDEIHCLLMITPAMEDKKEE